MGEVEAAITDYVRREFMIETPDLALAADMDLLDEGIIDSLGIFVLVDFLEEHFGIEVRPDDVVLEHFETVRAISDLVSAKLRSQKG
jgi:acyl carrier protein